MVDEELRVYRRKLPYWRLDGSTYFVNWRVDRCQPELQASERTCVARAICHRESVRYQLFAWVVMNDHVHVVLMPLQKYQLEGILHSWRSYTTNALQRAGRIGRVWQPEYMNRIIRNEAELRETVAYVLNNPTARWPGVQDSPLGMDQVARRRG